MLVNKMGAVMLQDKAHIFFLTHSCYGNCVFVDEDDRTRLRGIFLYGLVDLLRLGGVGV